MKSKGKNRKVLVVGCSGICPVGLNYLVKKLKAEGVNVIKVDRSGGVELTLEGSLRDLEKEIEGMGFKVLTQEKSSCCR
jgi:predicted ATP-grasp superfamily ATP-dependent carboligase